jgi:hypothetical protein
VDDDGYVLFLKPLGIGYSGSSEKRKMAFEGAAEYLWAMLIRPLQE